MLNEFVGRDAYKTRRQSALWREYVVGARGDFANCFGDRNVLGQVEVMQTFGTCDLGNRDIRGIGETRLIGISSTIERERMPGFS